MDEKSKKYNLELSRGAITMAIDSGNMICRRNSHLFTKHGQYFAQSKDEHVNHIEAHELLLIQRDPNLIDLPEGDVGGGGVGQWAVEEMNAELFNAISKIKSNYKFGPL